jgi:hypothetical protein
MRLACWLTKATDILRIFSSYCVARQQSLRESTSVFPCTYQYLAPLFGYAYDGAITSLPLQALKTCRQFKYAQLSVTSFLCEEMHSQLPHFLRFFSAFLTFIHLGSGPFPIRLTPLCLQLSETLLRQRRNITQINNTCTACALPVKSGETMNLSPIKFPVRYCLAVR